MDITAVTSRAMSAREREAVPDRLRTSVQKKIAPRADQHDREGSFGDAEALPQAGPAAWAAKVMATQACRDITDMAFQVCGARSTRATYNFDRFWRDATAFALHDPVDRRREVVGKAVLGIAEPPVAAL